MLMSLNDLLEHSTYTEQDCEFSYRRGVHQAYSMLRQILESDGGDPMEMLRLFEKYASLFRGSLKAHPLLIHEIQEKVNEELVNKRGRQKRRNNGHKQSAS